MTVGCRVIPSSFKKQHSKSKLYTYCITMKEKSYWAGQENFHTSINNGHWKFQALRGGAQWPKYEAKLEIPGGMDYKVKKTPLFVEVWIFSRTSHHTHNKLVQMDDFNLNMPFYYICKLGASRIWDTCTVHCTCMWLSYASCLQSRWQQLSAPYRWQW